MSLKRSLVDGYQDPDYPQTSEMKRKRNSIVYTPGERNSLMRSIIRREFQRELTLKDNELKKVEHNLAQAKKLLQHVRYAVVSSYYTKKGLESAEAMAATATATATSTSELATANFEITAQQTAAASSKVNSQTAIHPSLKKLLGKHPIDYDEILRMRPTRQAAKTAKTTISEKLRSKKDEKRLKSATNNVTIAECPTVQPDVKELVNQKIPRYVEPLTDNKTVPQLNSSRGRNQTKHLIVVGNTSKYVGDEKSADSVTHKWLIYVRSKTECAIEKLIAKVRFFLHPSYKPNDVVEISNAPFHLARRGWGEFPVRVQLYFNRNIQQKPLQIIHNLVLDRKHTGLQTMGAETVVEVWLNVMNEPKANSEKPTDSATVVDEDFMQRNSDLFASFIDGHDFDLTKYDLFNAPISILSEKFDEHLLDETKPAEQCILKQENGVTQRHDEPEQHVEENRRKSGGSTSVTAHDIAHDDEAEQKPTSLLPIVLPKIENPPWKPLPSRDTAIGELNSRPLLNLKTENNASATLQQRSGHTAANQNAFTIKPPVAVVRRHEQKKQIVMKNGQIYINDPEQIKIRAKQTQISLLKTNSQSSLLKGNCNERVADAASVVHVDPPTNFSFFTDHDYISTRPPIKVEPVLKARRSVSSGAGGGGSSGCTTNIITLNDSSNKKITVVLTKDPDHCEVISPFAIDELVDEDSYSNLSTLKSVFPSRIKKLQQCAILAKSGGVCQPNAKPKLIDHRAQLNAKFVATKFVSMRTAVAFLLKRMPLVSDMAAQLEYRSSFPYAVDTLSAYESLILPKQRCIEWLRAKYVQNAIKMHPHLSADALWSTKEIVLFARKFAYTPLPASQVRSHSVTNNLQDIIKEEIKREKQLLNILTSNASVNVWLDSVHATNCTSAGRHFDGGHIIDIEQIDTDVNASGHSYADHGSNDVIAIDLGGHKQSEWVMRLCRMIQVKLKPEEIVPDVFHASAQCMLEHALSAFVEDLLRHANAECVESTANMDATLNVSNIKTAINKRREFAFLTNKNMGMSQI